MEKQDDCVPTRFGRPPKPAEEARSRRTVTFLTQLEYSRLENIARRNKMSISSAAHHLLVQSINAWD
ncbi:MAG: hypothetical protein ABJN62_01375 [Halioglobus sp.]